MELFRLVFFILVVYDDHKHVKKWGKVMNTYQIEVAIFDQESFVEGLGDKVKILEQTNAGWNYENLKISTDFTREELEKFFDEAFEGVLDWTFKE